MPPQNRARKFGGGGGGIDLGALLMAVYGGVSPSPEAGLAQAAQGASEVIRGSETEKALRSGAQNKPFKANTIFDRAEANNLNAQFGAQQSAADMQQSRELEGLRARLPISAEDYANQQTAQTAGHKDRGQFDYELGQKGAVADDERKRAAAILQQHLATLGSNNVAYNPYDIKKWMTDVNPEQIKAVLDGLQTKMAINQALRQDTERDQFTKGATYSDNLSTAQTQAKSGRAFAEGQAAQVPDLLSSIQVGRDQDLKAKELELMRGKLMPGSAPIVDITANPFKTAYTPPLDPQAAMIQQVMQQKMGGMLPPTNLQTNMPQPVAEPMVEVEIDGMKVRIPQSQAAKLTGAR